MTDHAYYLMLLMLFFGRAVDTCNIRNGLVWSEVLIKGIVTYMCPVLFQLKTYNFSGLGLQLARFAPL